MPEGSLNLSITDLRTALEGISGLVGEVEADETPGSGFRGVSELLSKPPLEILEETARQLAPQLSSVLSFEGETAIGGAGEVFSTAMEAVDLVPGNTLQLLEQRIGDTDGAFNSNFIQTLQAALDAVNAISNNVPQDRTGVASALMDQILGVLMSLEGSEAETIQAWISSINQLYDEVMPLIEAIQNGGSPQDIVVIFQRSLENTLNAFGYAEVKKVVDFVEIFPPAQNVEEQISGIPTILSSVVDQYGGLNSIVQGDIRAFRYALAEPLAHIQDLSNQLRPLNRTLRRISSAGLFQPQALEAYLREQMNKALAIKIDEVQKIDDPFNILLDRIDEAVDGIDLSFVRDNVLGYFETIRIQIEQVDMPSLADTLDQGLEPLDQATQALQQEVTNALGQLAGFSAEAGDQLRANLSTLGTFQADGSFRYNFQQQMEELLSSAQLTIAGDPENPDAFSLTGSIEELQQSIDQLLNQVLTLLQEVEGVIDGLTGTAVDGINSFSTFITGLDIPALLEQLRAKVEEILDALAPIQFALVVAPVVAEIDENTTKLQSVDTSELNDILREALKLALDVVISIDFTTTISTPLKEQFAQIKAIPAEAIDTLQQRYEEALQELDQLSPTQLLGDLFAAFDIIQKAVAPISTTDLLEPLDALHVEYLQQPLAQLTPSRLLQPLSDAFDEATGAFDQIEGAALIEPLNGSLNELKSLLDGFDITAIDQLITAVEKVKQDIADIRPSEVFVPLTAEFARLESELDRFKPSVVFQPIVEMAEPLLALLQDVQQETIDALHEIFQTPLQVLERLQPQAMVERIREQIDNLLQLLNALNIPVLYNQLKGQYYDLSQSIKVQNDPRRKAYLATIDPERVLGGLMSDYNELLAALEQIKDNVALPELDELYGEMQERLMAMLPGYASNLLDAETFKRYMNLANPARFLEELDQRFETIKNRLIPIRPEELTAELDETYDAVIALVEDLELTEALNQIKARFENIKSIITDVRVDFLAGDIDAAVNDVRAVVEALNPAAVIGELDLLHAELQQVVDATLPSRMFSGLDQLSQSVKDIVDALDPETTLGQPLDAAWLNIQNALGEIDVTVVLQPLMDKLDELEEEFETGLRRTETSFDQMLGASRTAIGGSGGSAGVSI